MYTQKKLSGFTIVELLIVIVVIAVLAAVSVVAYNGIQQRAKASEASAALAQAKKKLELYKVDAGGYPATGSLATAGITNGNVDYQYTSNGTTYCITGTTGNVSYKVSDVTNPTQGGCNGHGQGGVGAITNLEPNPSFETTVANAAGAGTNTRTLSTMQKVSGSNSTRFVWVSGSSGVQTSIIPVSPSTAYTVSLYIFSESGALPGFNIAASDYATNSQSMGAPSSAGSWQRIARTYTTASSQTTLRAWTTVGSASTFYVDSVMVTQGATLHNYADGSSSDWAWSGAVNNSTSTGPPL